MELCSGTPRVQRWIDCGVHVCRWNLAFAWMHPVQRARSGRNALGKLWTILRRVLLAADVGVDATDRIVDAIRNRVSRAKTGDVRRDRARITSVPAERAGRTAAGLEPRSLAYSGTATTTGATPPWAGTPAESAMATPRQQRHPEQRRARRRLPPRLPPRARSQPALHDAPPRGLRRHLVAAPATPFFPPRTATAHPRPAAGLRGRHGVEAVAADRLKSPPGEIGTPHAHAPMRQTPAGPSPVDSVA